jgi:hypothetical protein
MRYAGYVALIGEMKAARRNLVEKTDERHHLENLDGSII